jgi:hypothetical protein
MYAGHSDGPNMQASAVRIASSELAGVVYNSGIKPRARPALKNWKQQ